MRDSHDACCSGVDVVVSAVKGLSCRPVDFKTQETHRKGDKILERNMYYIHVSGVNKLRCQLFEFMI